jgi:hypothetical protein
MERLTKWLGDPHARKAGRILGRAALSAAVSALVALGLLSEQCGAEVNKLFGW